MKQFSTGNAGDVNTKSRFYSINLPLRWWTSRRQLEVLAELRQELSSDTAPHSLDGKAGGRFGGERQGMTRPQ